MKRVLLATISLAVTIAIASGIAIYYSAGQQTNQVAAPAHKFTAPIVPKALASNAQRVEYLIDHYWDGYNFCDTILLQDEEQTRAAFVAYMELLARYGTKQTIAPSINSTLERSFAAGSEAFATFTGLFEKYLYDPNSPYRNDDIYVIALGYIIDNPNIDDIEKIRPKHHLKVASQNRVGQKANDFTYTLRSGKSGTMHQIEAEFLLLYFNNPDCHDCERVMQHIEESATINALHESGRLKILSIYPDAELDVWKEADYPKVMINGYDKQMTITQEQLYDLKAIPTLYLLNGDKEVILKDAPIETIEKLLKQQ